MEDWAAAMAFALASLPNGSGPILLAGPPRRKTVGMPLYGEGLAELGIDPARLLLVEAADELALLRAGLEATGCPALAAVILQTWGSLPRYDLTASRRLVLAAERSGVPAIVLRGDAPPRASAAHSRWLIRSAPSVPLAARAPGSLVIEAELLRRRGGPAGLRWRLEWDYQNGLFRTGDQVAGNDTAPLPGLVVPLAGLRKARA